MSQVININISEIFYSIQGEGSFSGYPCIFIRTAGCSLRCTYCDTKYAWKFQNPTPLKDIIKKAKSFPTKLVLLTGGEPLEEENILKLIQELHTNNYKVLIETGGHIEISNIPKYVHLTVDVKTPGSGEAHKNLIKNYSLLKNSDELKFVICDENDYHWSKDFIKENLINFKGEIIFSPSWGELDPKYLAENILKDGLNVKLQTQLHKNIWGEKRGH